MKLDDGVRNYLQGLPVSFPVENWRTLCHAVTDFAAMHIPADNTPHIRSKFYAALECVLVRHFPSCSFGKIVSESKRVVSFEQFLD
jgi:hypothetical protein